MGEGRNSFKVVTGKPAGKYFDRRKILEIKLKEMGVMLRSWIDSAQDRSYWRALVCTTMNFPVPQSKVLFVSIQFHIKKFELCKLLARIEQVGNSLNILTRKPTGTRLRWEDNIMTDPK